MPELLILIKSIEWKHWKIITELSRIWIRPAVFGFVEPNQQQQKIPSSITTITVIITTIII